ncbi:MAG TPA: hypothetical protein VGD00_09720 [Solirubrobacteraceae bacterium]|jgi:hypothetical protein
MGARVVISAFDVLQFPLGGGHFSAYLQYVHGLRGLGCEVWWLERLMATDDPAADRRVAAELSERLGRAGLPDRLIVYTGDGEERRFLTVEAAEAEAVFAQTDLLLNFNYEVHPELLSRFRRTALVDIDPGLLQLWMNRGDLAIAAHDLYFTTGETVGTPAARFPSGGVDWLHIRPPVSLEQWPLAQEQPREAFTTVSSWWSEEWAAEGDESGWYENSKRASFIEYLTLPSLAAVPLELALNVDEGDGEDVALLERNGWHVRSAEEVTATPADYRAYVQRSAGEFSCAKPSCMRLQNAWVSDRTICYLASGRPAVVQHTGPSSYLDGGWGVLRFSTVEQAAQALEAVHGDYARHSAAARELAVEHFDARKVAGEMLAAALGSGDLAASTTRD